MTKGLPGGPGKRRLKRHRLRRIGAPAAACALLTSGLVVALAVGDTPDGPGRGTQHRSAALHTLALKEAGTARREVPRTDTSPFSLVGISWDHVKVKLRGDVQVRTRSSATGDWSGWRDLELRDTPPDVGKGNGRGLRGATEPLWVGASDGVEARVVAGNGTATGLPAGMRLDLVDPGTGNRAEADSGAGAAVGTSGAGTRALGTQSFHATYMAYTAETSPSPGPTSATGPRCLDGLATAPQTPPATVPRPPILTRAEWGADESIVQCPTVYSPSVKAVIVHHEAGNNNYSCAQSPAMVRSIQLYHVKTQGWGDIGYNFVVDKCGRIFEGSKGGMDKPVKARHTLGFNPETVGVSLLGNMETAKPSQAALRSIYRIAAWKLGMYGEDPTGKTTLTAEFDNGRYTAGQTVEVDRILSHRDVMSTACPGQNLWDQLPMLRKRAASPAAKVASPAVDFNRDGVPDLVAGTPGTSSGAGSLTVVPGSTTGPVASAKRAVSQSSSGVPGASEAGDSFGADSAWGDVNGDGYADLAVGAPGEDDTSGHTDSGAVTLLYGPGLNTGTAYTTSSATRASGEKLGTSVVVADFTADARADIFAVAPGKPGRWWMFDPRTGAKQSGYLGGDAYGSAVAYTDAALGDFNSDGMPDVAVNYRDPSGTARIKVLHGSADGLSEAGELAFPGGRAVAAGDIDGDGFDDLAVGQPSAAESGTGVAGGRVAVYYGSATGLPGAGSDRVSGVYQDTTGVPGAAESGDAMGSSVSVGDYDLDGYADVLTGLPGEDITRDGTARTNAGSVLLLRGGSSGLTGTGALSYSQDTSGIGGATESADRFGSSVALTDLSGWGRADLAIGVDGEDTGDGTILQLDSGSSGVSTTTGVYYGRSALGTPAGARLGQRLMP